MRELDILFMEAGDAIDKYNDQMLISFMEGANPPKTDGIITKIKKLVESVIKKIKDFFEGKKTKDNIDKIEKAIKANPSLKNQKVKVKDYSKVEKLDKETSAKLKKCKSKEEAERLMNKYDKQRKALMLTLPVVTITVAGVLGYLLHGKNQTISKIEGYASDLTKDINDLNIKNKKLSDDLEREKSKHSKATKYINSLNKEKKSIEAENKKLNGIVTDQKSQISDLEDLNFEIKYNYSILNANSHLVLRNMNEYGGTAVQHILNAVKVSMNPNINKDLAKKYTKYQQDKNEITDFEFKRTARALGEIRSSKEYR